MYKFIKYEIENGVATLTLNRPKVYNALNDEITFEIHDAVKKSSKDEEVRVLVLTGEGKAFCSGQDLKASGVVEDKSFYDSLLKRYNPIIRGLREMPKPVICRLNGVAAGAGCSLVLACDMIIANEEAQLIEVFINIGLVLDSGSSFFLPRAIGYAKAFEISTMGSRISGKQAAEMGLVNMAVPIDKLDETVKTYSDYYAKAPTMAVGLIKKQLNKSFGFNLEEALNYEALTQEIAGKTEDYQEGINAFLEKRKAAFKGR